MAFWMVALVALVTLGALTLYVLREQSIERDGIDRRLHDPNTPTLEYAVPTGQDPVEILAVLERAGFTASVDPHHTHQHVLIACPDGVEHDRTRVRDLIASASAVTPSWVHEPPTVRFVDEQ